MTRVSIRMGLWCGLLETMLEPPESEGHHLREIQSETPDSIAPRGRVRKSSAARNVPAMDKEQQDHIAKLASADTKGLRKGAEPDHHRARCQPDGVPRNTFVKRT